MKRYQGYLSMLAALCFVVFVGFGVMLPFRIISSGVEDFKDREKRFASGSLFHISDFYGNGFLEIGDYNGPPLVLGWYVDSVRECPSEPYREEIEQNDYQDLVGGQATVKAYTLFGIPRGEMKVTCAGHRQWESYF